MSFNEKSFFSLLKENLTYHKVRTLLIFLTLVGVSTFFLSINIIGTGYQYSIGDIAKENINVSRDIRYINQYETKMEEKRVSEVVPLIFERDGSILRKKLVSVKLFFETAADILKEDPPITKDDLKFQLIAFKAALKKNKYPKFKNSTLTAVLRQDDPLELKKIANKALIYIYDNNKMGILKKPYKNELKIKNKNVLVQTLNTPNKVEDISGTLKDLKTFKQIYKSVYKISRSLAPNLSKKTLLAVVRIIRRHLRSNLKFNPEETKKRLEEEIKKVKPVMGLLKKGLNIVRHGDIITADMLNKINIINRQTRFANINYIIGVFSIQLIFFFLFIIFLFNFRDKLIPDQKAAYIVFSLGTLFIMYSFFISRTDYIVDSNLNPVFFLPIPFITMIISIFYNVYLSSLVGIYILSFTFLLFGVGDLNIIAPAFSSALIGVFASRNIEKRIGFIRTGFVLGFSNALIITSIALMQKISFLDTITNIQLSFVNGIVNVILFLGIFPLYESLFNITTKFKLLELSDLNAEVFKKMLVDAPGTYHHSLIVSTLAEAACKEIGANHLLARVGAFYHDIGKIEDGGMYTENNVTDSRAKSLSPEEYSKFIISHVEKGITIAKKNGLPKAVIDFIKEHHGQSVMIYFYHQALKSKGENNIQEKNEDLKNRFRYPGPKPQSKETAVVMLADAVEAASRALSQPNYENIKNLISEVIFNKINEGELEEADISMVDLKTIQGIFLKILSGIYHTRIEYPNNDKLKKLEEERKNIQVAN